MKENELKPFDKVLVRESKDDNWRINIFEQVAKSGEYLCLVSMWKYCIPYEGNEHLLGKTDDYDEPYVPQDGDFVVADDSKDSTIFIYNEKYSNPKYFGTYIGLYRGRNDLSLWESDAWCDRHRKLRLATEEEKQLLLSKLAENGKKWNPEKKCIEDEYQPNDGDFVAWGCSDRPAFSIFRKGNKMHFPTYVSLYRNGDIGIDDINTIEKEDKLFRPATDTEKQQLLDALHKEGKEWDFEKKEIVEYKWRPEFKEQYWSITFDHEEWKFKASLFRWYNVKISKTHLDENIVFKFKDDAEKEAERRNELLKLA